MFQIGLTSISFRSLTVEEVAALAKRSGLDGIEWGTDVHVKNVEEARHAAEVTAAAGLKTLSVGSYYYIGKSDPAVFDTVMDIADTLGTDTVRVWAGAGGSADVDEETRAAWTAQLAKDVSRAAARGITVSTEWHAHTLTDTLASAQRLLDDVPGLTTYWQPVVFLSDDENLAALKAVLPRVTNIHAFSWELENGAVRRFPLGDHAEVWSRYMQAARDFGGERSVMIEFVLDDKPEQCLPDAAALRGICGE